MATHPIRVVFEKLWLIKDNKTDLLVDRFRDLLLRLNF